MKQTRQPVRAIKPSIYLDVYGTACVVVDFSSVSGRCKIFWQLKQENQTCLGM